MLCVPVRMSETYGWCGGFVQGTFSTGKRLKKMERHASKFKIKCKYLFARVQQIGFYHLHCVVVMLNSELMRPMCTTPFVWLCSATYQSQQHALSLQTWGHEEAQIMGTMNTFRDSLSEGEWKS